MCGMSCQTTRTFYAIKTSMTCLLRIMLAFFIEFGRKFRSFSINRKTRAPVRKEKIPLRLLFPFHGYAICHDDFFHDRCSTIAWFLVLTQMFDESHNGTKTQVADPSEYNAGWQHAPRRLSNSVFSISHAICTRWWMPRLCWMPADKSCM